jgi:hypothetical protein
VTARSLLGAVLLGAGLSTVIAILLAAQWIVVGAPASGWFYGYARPFTLALLGPFVPAVALCCALLALMRSGARSPRPAVWLLVWLIASAGVEGLIRWHAPYSLESVFVSDESNSFYSVAQQFTPVTLLKRHHRFRDRMPLHAQSNMPGKVMLIQFLQTISRRTEVLPLLVILLSNAGAVLIYLFVVDLFSDERTGLFAAVLYLFTPGRLLFLPLMNTVTPVFALACAFLLWRWLRTGRTSQAVLAGVATYALVFFEPLPLVLGLLFAALAILALVRGDITPKRFVAQSAAFTVAFGLTAAFLTVAFDFDSVGAFMSIGSHAVEFNAITQRPYGTWVRANLFEFLLGVGPCQAVIFAAMLWQSVAGSGDWQERVARPGAVVALGLLAVLAATNLAGLNRGEVFRLWIFLACFFQIPVAYACATTRTPYAIMIAVTSALLLTCVAASTMRLVIP